MPSDHHSVVSATSRASERVVLRAGIVLWGMLRKEYEFLDVSVPKGDSLYPVLIEQDPAAWVPMIMGDKAP